MTINHAAAWRTLAAWSCASVDRAAMQPHPSPRSCLRVEAAKHHHDHGGGHHGCGKVSVVDQQLYVVVLGEDVRQHLGLPHSGVGHVQELAMSNDGPLLAGVQPLLHLLGQLSGTNTELLPGVVDSVVVLAQHISVEGQGKVLGVCVQLQCTLLLPGSVAQLGLQGVELLLHALVDLHGALLVNVLVQAPSSLSNLGSQPLEVLVSSCHYVLSTLLYCVCVDISHSFV
mmetsp:Transcript_8994/g.19306  ORF Transcript_8994/g.19306 Transcript_8994/m.19306 type:complete len:228 (+) Transcript_8994:587-1270(+)